MNWNGNTIVDLYREFLNSNGAPKYTDIEVEAPADRVEEEPADSADSWVEPMSNLNVSSQKGLFKDC